MTDGSGAVIPGAAVTVSNKETGLARATLTTPEGRYTVAALSPGVYEVRGEAKGFLLILRPATVETGSTTQVDLQMQVGATKTSSRSAARLPAPK